MSQGLKLAFVLVVGILLGGVTVGTLVGRHWSQNLANWYSLGVANQANVAREIYGGRGQELAEQIKLSFPASVLAIDREFSETEWSQPALWLVQEVYEQSSTPVPLEIAPILRSLPPKPSGCCELPSELGS